MIKAPEALWWPQNLEYFSYNDKLDCYLEFEPPDYGVNYHGAAYLVHAFAGGVDITDMLSDDVTKAIEGAACLHFSGF